MRRIVSASRGVLALWRRRSAIRATPGVALLAKGHVEARELDAGAATPDPLTPDYPAMVARIASLRLNRPPAMLPGPWVGLTRSRREWQRLLSARSQAAVQRLIQAGARR